MTLHGEAALQEELRRLKSEDRPRIIEAIATARALGDLKENAEYHASREQQGFIEGRILEIEGKLAHAKVIDVTQIPNQNRVVFGCTVTFVNLANDEKMRYQIVGEDEANIKNNKISYSSPIGKALIGKSLDDVVLVEAPGGRIEYEIINIEHLA